MTDTLDKGELFLLEEYKTATELTSHIDELRNKWTSFYLIFASVAVASVVFLLKEELVVDIFGEADVSVAILLFAIALLGVPVVAGLARLRKVQLRYFAIINNIRKYFLKKNFDLWNAAQLSEQTLPKVRRTSGTYMWVVMVFFTSCGLFALGSYMISRRLLALVCSSADVVRPIASLIALLVFAIAVILEDKLYMKWSKPREAIVYSQSNDPLNAEPNQHVV